ncbi:Uncharacterised protein [Mycobacterium tuberculosis]|nr:Uncharacterised protein [Mycobacterium tuberculosis]
MFGNGNEPIDACHGHLLECLGEAPHPVPLPQVPNSEGCIHFEILDMQDDLGADQLRSDDRHGSGE